MTAHATLALMLAISENSISDKSAGILYNQDGSKLDQLSAHMMKRKAG